MGRKESNKQTKQTTLTNFSMKYLVMYKIFTDVGIK